MGTHPIFESDFDCLTANSDTFLPWSGPRPKKLPRSKLHKLPLLLPLLQLRTRLQRRATRNRFTFPSFLCNNSKTLAVKRNKSSTNFFGARQAVQSWKENMEMGDDKIFVPMTNSLLVPGKMAEGAMLVELGGGIMMEKSIEDTIKFMDRRMQMVTSSMNKCGSELQQKAMAGQAIEKEMESKMKEMNLYNKIYQ